MDDVRSVMDTSQVEESPDGQAADALPQHAPDELQRFVNARKRPAVFFFIADSLNIFHLLILRRALIGHRFDELDIVINSGGGDSATAYQVIELLRLHTKTLNACVPFYAKSAATLMCLGADTIVLDEVAQLGPLDTQVRESRKGDPPGQGSALNPFKSLEELRKYSVEALDLAVKVILRRSGMKMDDCITHAIDFVRVTSGSLFSQVQAERLGQYSRALAEGQDYGERLLDRYSDMDEEQRATALERLVYGYPSHSYVVDHYELSNLGFNVEFFADDEREAVEGVIYPYCFQYSIDDELEPLIRLVEPSTAAAASQKSLGQARRRGKA